MCFLKGKLIYISSCNATFYPNRYSSYLFIFTFNSNTLFLIAIHNMAVVWLRDYHHIIDPWWLSLQHTQRPVSNCETADRYSLTQQAARAAAASP